MRKYVMLGAGVFCLLFTFCQTPVGERKQEAVNAEKQDSYEDLKLRIDKMHDSLSALYEKGATAQKDSLVDVARNYVFAVITHDLFKQWLGTPWDFNGCTHVPKQGKIACGQFVNAVLCDAGFDIPRNRWAQMASEPVIQILSPHLKRFSNKSIEEVQLYIKGRGDGLYLVGLDCHVGYIYKSGKEIKFVHSSYYEPEKGVMMEELDSENPLKNSKYRVVGKILDDEMMRKWLRREKYE
jgi:hypothetical protein